MFGAPAHQDTWDLKPHRVGPTFAVNSTDRNQRSGIWSASTFRGWPLWLTDTPKSVRSLTRTTRTRGDALYVDLACGIVVRKRILRMRRTIFHVYGAA